jgi:hypothetical protein
MRRKCTQRKDVETGVRRKERKWHLGDGDLFIFEAVGAKWQTAAQSELHISARRA